MYFTFFFSLHFFRHFLENIWSRSCWSLNLKRPTWRSYRMDGEVGLSCCISVVLCLPPPPPPSSTCCCRLSQFHQRQSDGDISHVHKVKLHITNMVCVWTQPTSMWAEWFQVWTQSLQMVRRCFSRILTAAELLPSNWKQRWVRQPVLLVAALWISRIVFFIYL